MRRCALKVPWKKRPIIKASPALSFAGDMNVLLGYYKCMDDWTDEKKPLAGSGMLVLKRAYRRAALRRPVLEQSAAEHLHVLARIEKVYTSSSVLDASSDAFASLMRACMQHAPIKEEAKKTMCVLMYHLGKWIYLMDAWEDREKDQKSGSFNPFLAAEAGRERAAFLLHASLNEAIKAYELLPIVSSKGILDNIFYEGCVNRTKLLLEAGGKHEQ